MTDFIKKTGLGIGSGVKIGGAEIDKWDDTFNDVDTGVTAKINVPFIFRDDRLKLYDSSGSSKIITISTPSLASNIQLSIPALTANDTFAMLGTIRGMPGNYFIYKVSSTYYAYNCVTNTTSDVTANTDFKTLLTAVIALLPTGGCIWLGPGDFSLATLLTITTNNIIIRGCEQMSQG